MMTFVSDGSFSDDPLMSLTRFGFNTLLFFFHGTFASP